MHDERPEYTEEAGYLPFATTDLTGARVLVLAPHPDDESIACGGALALHRDADDPVKVVFLTDGALGVEELAQDPAAAAALREAEARAAARALGVEDLEFWGIPDRQLVADAATGARLRALLEGYRPDLVYVASPFDAHPDHRAAAALAWGAVAGRAPPPSLLFFETYQPMRVDTLVDITPVLERKRAACRAYASQLAQLPYLEVALGLARYRSMTVAAHADFVEGFVRVPPGVPAARSLEGFMLDHFRPPRRGAGEAPLVSIVVRTRNRLPSLRAALESLAVQTHPRLEAIVVVDAGDDAGPVLADFEHKLGLRVLRPETAMGRYRAANAGLAAATGKYLGFLDDDDVLYPDHLAKLVAVLESSGAAVAYSDCAVVEVDHGAAGPERCSAPRPFPTVDFDRDRLYFENYLPIHTVLFRRELLGEVEPFDENLEHCADWDFWIRLAERAPFRRVPGVTCEYRRDRAAGVDYAEPILRVYRKHWPTWSPELLARAVWPVAGARELEIERLRARVAALEAELDHGEVRVARVARSVLRRLARGVRVPRR